jgi:hypothetical protein
MHEEVNYFPEIEKATRQKGVMDGEVEQHGKNNQVTIILQDPTDVCHSGLPRRSEDFQGLLVKSQKSRVRIQLQETSRDHGLLF